MTAIYSSLAIAFVALFFKNQPPVASEMEVTRSSLWSISSRELILIISASVVWALPNAGFIVLVGFLPDFLVSKGIEIAKAGMLVSVIYWICIGSIPLGGWLTDRTGRINTFIIIGVILSALFITLLPVGISVLTCILIIGLISGAWPGAIMSLPSQILSPQGRSTGFGVFYMLFYGIMAILPPIAGWLRDFTGGSTAPVLFGGCAYGLDRRCISNFSYFTAEMASRRNRAVDKINDLIRNA